MFMAYLFSLLTKSTTACTFMAWKPFLHTKLDSSSLAIPCIGIRVPSMAPATLGKLTTLRILAKGDYLSEVSDVHGISISSEIKNN
jgi:hypothetical protein